MSEELSRIEEIKKQTGADELHLLVPTMIMQRVNPFYSFVAIQVKADISRNSADIYKVGSVKVGNEWVDTYSPCKPFLERLAAAAGISINSASSYTQKYPRKKTFIGHVEPAIIMPDGFPRLVTSRKKK